MGQTPSRATRIVHALLLVLAMLMTGCQRDQETPAVASASPARPATRPTVASLVPSATDLLVGIGAADHLVAVSNFDNTARPELKDLPRAGDYQDVDWERITALRPDVMVIFQSPDRVPAGLKQKADALNIRLANVRPETLADLYAEALKLGDLVNERDKALAAVNHLRDQLQQVRQRTQTAPRVRTLLVTSDTGNGVAGKETFLDELLTIAGGDNVITTSGWIQIDNERLAALQPDAVIVLLPGVSPQVEQQAQHLWQSRPAIPAVANGRVFFINRWYALQPGFHVGELARQIADALHPAVNSTQSSPLSPRESR